MQGPDPGGDRFPCTVRVAPVSPWESAKAVRISWLGQEDDARTPLSVAGFEDRGREAQTKESTVSRT